MKISRYEAAEPLSAHHILCGRLAPPSRRDPHPFVPLMMYVSVRCPEAPAGWNPTADVHFDHILAELLRSACGIREGLLRGTMNLDAARIAVRTLRDRCKAHGKRLDGNTLFDDAGDTEAASTDTARLGKLCAASLAGCGDRDALIELAETAETCNALGLSGFAEFPQGARALLATVEDLREWRPGPPLPIIQECLDLGRAIIARRDQAQAPKTHAEAIDYDRAGINCDAPPAEPEPEPEAPGVVVFPSAILDTVGKSENKQTVKQTLGAALGARLPFVPVPTDWNAWEASLVARSPWLAAVPRALGNAQGGREHWGHSVVGIVGPPGCGKTRQIRELAETSGLAYARLNAEGAADTAAFGTSVRWMSAQAGIVERTLAQAKAATALIHYDELEKSSGSRQSNSGKLTDLLHGLWERETARAWMSVWLHHPIDAGHIVHVVTMNSLDGLPSSLLDRMAIVRVGEPGPEHLAVLAPQVAREICRELGQDERFGVLDGDEMQALAQSFRGGSIRRLQRLVAGLLQARESGPAALPRH